MSRLILSTSLIIIAAVLFFTFTNPRYEEVKILVAENKQFDEALLRSKELQFVRDELLNKYNMISTEDLEKIKKLLPDNVDNIRLILDLDGIASTYGLLIRNVSISDGSSNEGTRGGAQSVQISNDLDQIQLQFNVTSSYENFKNFMRDLEQSLRIVDLKTLTVTTQDETGDILNFGLTIKTYWLK